MVYFSSEISLIGFILRLLPLFFDPDRFVSSWRAACGWVRRRYRTNSILTGIASDSRGIENGRGIARLVS